MMFGPESMQMWFVNKHKTGNPVTELKKQSTSDPKESNRKPYRDSQYYLLQALHQTRPLEQGCNWMDPFTGQSGQIGRFASIWATSEGLSSEAGLRKYGWHLQLVIAVPRIIQLAP